MPEKQPPDVKTVKIPVGKKFITALIISIITVLVAILSFTFKPVFLNKWTGTPRPAVEPATPTRDWFVIFELKFPANYWSVGVHSLLFDANCPADINATGENGPDNAFSVDRGTEKRISTVFIRRRGLYLTEINGDAFGHLIHPSQETEAIYSLSAFSYADAKRLRDECKVFTRVDGGPLVNLAAKGIEKIR